MSAEIKLSLLRGLRASAAIELVTNGNAVRYIETLSAEERWKVYRDLESFFGQRAEQIEIEQERKAVSA